MGGEKLIIFPLIVSFIMAIPTFLFSTLETITFSFLGLNFNLTFSDFFLLLTASVATIAVVAGINILGSGLNDTGTLLVFKVATFSILWIMLIGVSGVGLIPYVGFFAYWGLSLLFMIGVILNVGGG